MHLSLDVVVQRVLVVGLGELDQRHPIGHSELGRFEDAVRVAEGGAGQSRGRQPQVRRTEPGRASGPAPSVVQRAVLRSLGSGHVIVGATEDAALPGPTVTARMCRQSAVARTGLELGTVDPVTCHGFKDKTIACYPVGMEVHRHPERRIDPSTIGKRRDVSDGTPLCVRSGGFRCHFEMMPRRLPWRESFVGSCEAPSLSLPESTISASARWLRIQHLQHVPWA